MSSLDSLKRWLARRTPLIPPLKPGFPPVVLVADAQSDVLDRLDETLAEADAARGALVDAIVADFHPRTVCAIGPGVGGEELRFVRAGAAITLIEPDEACVAVLRTRFPAGRILHVPLKWAAVPADERFDIIYTSSPSHWMRSDPLRGVDRDVLRFAEAHLAPDGALVALVYGGRHHPLVLSSTSYLDAVEHSIAACGLTLVGWGLDAAHASALVVVARHPMSIRHLVAWGESAPPPPRVSRPVVYDVLSVAATLLGSLHAAVAHARFAWRQLKQSRR